MANSNQNQSATLTTILNEIMGIKDQLKVLQPLRDEIAALRKENLVLKTGLKQMISVINSNTRYLYGQNVLIHGISENPDESKSNLHATVLPILNSLNSGSGISLEDVENVHRLGPFVPNSPKTRAIVVKLRSKNIRNVIASKAREMRPPKGIKSSGPYVTSHTPFNKLLEFDSLFSLSDCTVPNQETISPPRKKQSRQPHKRNNL